MGTLKVFVLMAAMTAIFAAVGGALGGTGGAWLALAFAVVMNFFAYFN
jgi:heat shock protein HtpX